MGVLMLDHEWARASPGLKQLCPADYASRSCSPVCQGGLAPRMGKMQKKHNEAETVVKV